MTKTIEDYLQESDKRFRKDLLKFTVDQIIDKSWTTAIWNDVIATLENWACGGLDLWDEDEKDPRVEAQELAYFATRDAAKVLWERMVNWSTYPSADDIEEVFKENLEAFIAMMDEMTEEASI